MRPTGPPISRRTGSAITITSCQPRPADDLPGVRRQFNSMWADTTNFGPMVPTPPRAPRSRRRRPVPAVSPSPASSSGIGHRGRSAITCTSARAVGSDPRRQRASTTRAKSAADLFVDAVAVAAAGHQVLLEGCLSHERDRRQPVPRCRLVVRRFRRPVRRRSKISWNSPDSRATIRRRLGPPGWVSDHRCGRFRPSRKPISRTPAPRTVPAGRRPTPTAGCIRKSRRLRRHNTRWCSARPPIAPAAGWARTSMVETWPERRRRLGFRPLAAVRHAVPSDRRGRDSRVDVLAAQRRDMWSSTTFR